MRSTLDEVLTTLRDLETYVNSIDPVNTALAAIADPLVSGFLTVRRQFDGAAFIVVLYAAFEKFVEELVWSHTELTSAAFKYDELADALRTKHMAQSGSLLTKGRFGAGRYANLTPGSVIANLHQCVSGGQPYKLNRHAVLHHDNNLRPAIVNEIFSLTGVADINDRVRNAESLEEWNLKVTAAPGPVPAGSIEYRLNDIVELRNQTSHTGVASGQVLGSAEMQDHLEFMMAYCRALYAVVAGDYLDRAYVGKPGGATALGAFREGPYHKPQGDAVVVSTPACRTHIGQAVIGKLSNRVCRWGTIKGIQIDGKPVPAVEAGDPVPELGLQVDFELTTGTQLYLLPAKDPAVWS